MKSPNEIPISEIVVKVLESIWLPAVKAAQLQKELNVRSLEETSAAARRAGFEVSYADLPHNVSGLVTPIGGKPHIVVNRGKSAEDQQYTVLHELGHCLLHVTPSPLADLPVSEIEGLADFQADIFAVMWIMRTEDNQKRGEMLKENPEVAVVTLVAGGMTVGILIFALIASVIRHFRSRLSVSSEEI